MTSTRGCGKMFCLFSGADMLLFISLYLSQNGNIQCFVSRLCLIFSDKSWASDTYRLSLSKNSETVLTTAFHALPLPASITVIQRPSSNRFAKKPRVDRYSENINFEMTRPNNSDKTKKCRNFENKICN